MKTHPLQLIILAASLVFSIESCVGPAYVETTPPPPAYTDAPPPPPQQPYYSDQADAAAPVSYQTFYNELSPYGQWISTPDYGYVWVPAAGPDFQPYATSGHWVLTTYGWTWVSDYSWGWAPFHYGTWDFDGTVGWFWIPGYQWSPAWVSWRSEPGYYGWAPLGPTYTSVGYANYYCPPERYVFVSATYINNPNVAVYYVPRAQNAAYYGHSTVIANTYYDRNSNNTYYAGPRQEEVERYTGRQIQPATITSAATPERVGASGSQVAMFRPSVVRPDNNAAIRPAPQTVYQRNNIAPAAQRPVLTSPNQPRVAPFHPENIQHGQANQQAPANQPNRAPTQQQQPQQRPVIQQQPSQQQPAQRQTQATPQQSPANNSYRAPIQQQAHQKLGQPQQQQRPGSPQQPRRNQVKPQQKKKQNQPQAPARQQ